MDHRHGPVKTTLFTKKAIDEQKRIIGYHSVGKNSRDQPCSSCGDVIKKRCGCYFVESFVDSAGEVRQAQHFRHLDCAPLKVRAVLRDLKKSKNGG